MLSFIFSRSGCPATVGRMMVVFLALISLASGTSAWSALTPDQKLADINQFIEMIESGYGPLEYKQKTIGLDLPRLAESYSKRAQKTQSDIEFFYLLVQFAAEFQDGHLSARLATNHLATLPIATDWIDNEVVVESKLVESTDPGLAGIEVGDRIVSVDGVPIASLMTDLLSRISAGHRASRLRIAAQSVARRLGRIHPVPRAPLVEIEILRQGETTLRTVQLNWVFSGTPFERRLTLPTHDPRDRDRPMIMLTSDISEEAADPRVGQSYRCSPTSRIERPVGSVVLFEAPFVAYYYPTPQGNVGYLRIPHYNWATDEEEAFVLSRYEEAVAIFERETVGLVIDQDHNCGGSIALVDRMASLFFSQPFETLDFSILATPREYQVFQSWLEYYQTTPLGPGFAQVVELLRETIETGERMTRKIPFFGTKMIQPNPIHYTKPIVLLADELSGSGGDYFPAVLQGNGRARVLGSRTFGAGGHVIATEPLANSGVYFTMTKSLFYRLDGNEIENRGVEPDFQYQPSLGDLTSGYRHYRDFYTDRLLSLLSRPSR